MYVYILQSTNFPNQTYTGKTRNIKQRLEAHNRGLNPSTNKYKPWKVVWFCWFPEQKLADDFEKYLKTRSGFAFRNKRLINGSI